MDPPNNNFLTHYLRNLYSIYKAINNTLIMNPYNWGLNIYGTEPVWHCVSWRPPNGLSMAVFCEVILLLFWVTKTEKIDHLPTVHMKWGLCGCDYDHVCL